MRSTDLRRHINLILEAETILEDEKSILDMVTRPGADAFDTFELDKGVSIKFFRLAHENGLTVMSDTGTDDATEITFFDFGRPAIILRGGDGKWVDQHGLGVEDALRRYRAANQA